jgi:hypothetical protein
MTETIDQFPSEDHRRGLVDRVAAGGFAALDDLEKLHFHAYRYAWRRVRLGDFAQKYQVDPRGDWFDGFFVGKAVAFYTDDNGLPRAERRPDPSPADIAHVEAVCVKIRANLAVIDERNRAAFARPALDPRAPGSSPGQALAALQAGLGLSATEEPPPAAPTPAESEAVAA